MPNTYSSLNKKHCTILIVEDNEEMRKLLSIFLETDDNFYFFLTLFARTLNEALDILSSGLVPDIAIIDLHLPNGSGLEVPRRIIEATEKATWPIILISGHYNEEYGEEGLRLSERVLNFVSKTRINRENFRIIIRHALVLNECIRRFRFSAVMKDKDGLISKRSKFSKLEPYAWALLGAFGGSIALWKGEMTAELIGTLFVAVGAACLAVWKERRKK